MYISGELIATLPVNGSRLHLPGYIDELRDELKDDHDDIIDLSKEPPQFFLDTLPSSMNWYRKETKEC